MPTSFFMKISYLSLKYRLKRQSSRPQVRLDIYGKERTNIDE